MGITSQSIIEKPPLLLSLIVTEKCNLDCVYCFVVDKSDREMSEEIAFETVERYLNSTSPEFDYVQIDFTGGEPLLCFPLISRVVEHVISGKWLKRFSFSIGTNGTLITPKIRKWADNYPCVTFALSFDGLQEAHDRNRSNSYKTVMSNIDFFKKWPDAKVKMTIGPDNVDKIAASVKHIHELGLDVAANVVFEDMWGDRKNEYLKIFDEQLLELIEFYGQNLDLNPPYLLNVPLEAVLFPRKKSHRFCGSGRNMVAVDVEGNEYPCHRFLPMSSSNPKRDPDLKFKKVKPEKCDACVLLSVCPSCLGYNYECHSNVDHRTTYHCEFIMLQAMATAKLEYLRLMTEVRKNPPGICDRETGSRIRRKIESIRLLATVLGR